jgi:hypothetical protein
LSTTYQKPESATATADPYPNKAIAAALTTLVTIGSQWVATGSLQFDQEGITALGGAVATVLVWFISNWKPLRK